MRHHARPAATHVRAQRRDRVRLDRRRGHHPRVREDVIKDAAILHVGSEQAKGRCRGLRPPNGRAARERPVDRAQQQVALAVERQRAHVAERFVIEVGQAGIGLERVEAAPDLARRERQHLDVHERMALAERRGDQRDGRQRSRDRPYPQRALEAPADLGELMPEPVVVREDAMRPQHDTLTLARKTLEALPAPHQRHAQFGLQLANSGRQRWLRNVARPRRASEMPLALERHEVLQLARVHGPTTPSWHGRASLPPSRARSGRHSLPWPDPHFLPKRPRRRDRLRDRTLAAGPPSRSYRRGCRRLTQVWIPPADTPRRGDLHKPIDTNLQEITAVTRHAARTHPTTERGRLSCNGGGLAKTLCRGHGLVTEWSRIF